jgi:Ni,Fe-hydrogenase III large subunit
LKVEIEAIKKRKTEEILEMENLGKRTGTTNARIINRIHEMEEIISIVEETIEEIDASVKESVKATKFLTQTI